MKNIKIERNGKLADVILHRQPVNALNEDLISELEEAFQTVERDYTISVVIIRSALPVFIAGADIKMMQEIQRNQETGRMLDYIRHIQKTYDSLEAMSKPTIAYISGHAMGGGLELALACDFRFMTSGEARIGLPEIQLGMIPGGGGTQRLTRLIGEAKAKDLIYNARRLSAEEAYQYGIVSRVVQTDTGLDEVYHFANELAQRAPLALAGIKRCIQSARYSYLAQGLEKEISESAKVFTSQDAKEGFQAFLEKRTPHFLGF